MQAKPERPEPLVILADVVSMAQLDVTDWKATKEIAVT